MRHVLIAVIVFLLLALQTPVLHVLNLSAYSMDVGLLAAMYLAATSDRFGGFVTSVGIGLLADSFTAGGILGMHMEILGIMFLMARGLAGRFHLLRPLPLVVVAFICSLTESLLFFLFSIMFDRNFSQYSTVLIWALPHALVTALLGPVVFLLFGAVDLRLRGRKPTAGGLLR